MAMRKGVTYNLPKRVQIASPFNKMHFTLYVARLFSSLQTTAIVTDDRSYLALKDFNEELDSTYKCPVINSENFIILIVDDVLDFDYKLLNHYHHIITECKEALLIDPTDMYIFLENDDYYKLQLTSAEQKNSLIYGRLSKRDYGKYLRDTNNTKGMQEFTLLDNEYKFSMWSNPQYEDLYHSLVTEHECSFSKTPSSVISSITEIFDGKGELTKKHILQIMSKGGITLW